MTTVEHENERQLSAANGVTVALARLEAILRRALARAATLHGDPSDNPFRGLHLGPDELARVFSRAPGVPLFAAAPDEALPSALSENARLASIADAYGLTEFDIDAVLIAVGPELDLRYERIYAYLQDDVTRRRPTVSLILDLLCNSAEAKLTQRARLTSDAPLMRSRVLSPSADTSADVPLLSTPVKVDEQILRFLLDEKGLDPRLAGFCRMSVSSVSFDASGLDDVTCDRLRALVTAGAIDPEGVTLCFHGRDETARTVAAHAAADAAGTALLVVDLEVDSDLDSLLPIVFREAQLQRAILLLEGWEALRDRRPASYRRLMTTLAGVSGIAIVSGLRPWVPATTGPKGVVSFAFDVPGFQARRACWAETLAVIGAEADPQLLDALASRFQLSASRIWDAVLSARNLARAATDAAVGGGGIPGAADLFVAARSQSGHELATLATRIDPVATWDDIVLPADAVEQLGEMCARMSLGHRVLGEWGFDRRLSQGKGVIALFSGPSGTGKTMAAEVIGNELGLDVYRIDLSAVVSKWIGETEKNLDRLFRLADNAILFFDEADALFGKRSEVREAHDRYANVEISYLLQKMEAYDGLAILATNLRHHLDEAFLRRLTFVIHFPFPDDVQRRQIWERIWPAATPLADDVDFDRLATTFKFSGGNVKNVALAAAYAAAARGSHVCMEDVRHAIRREYQKLGKTLTDSQLAGDLAAEPVEA